MLQDIRDSIRQHPKTWFYTSWLLLNLFQSYGTELLDDEAYYWVFSRYPDWGYFDHPPMIAILIRAGYAFFPNELGVRLFMALMNTATLFLIQQMLLKNQQKLFYTIAFSMGVLQIGGILAVPDIPLTFFTALFFWQYRRFLAVASVVNALLLGLIMALMLYSKYHGVLIIFFTFLSNPKLFLQWKAWVAAVVGALLFSPHLWWQYTHDFPSVMYHLKERNAPEYSFAFSLDYLTGQILLAGPLIGWLLLYAAGQFRSKDLFARALQFSLWGIYGFFLVSTLKGRVEANWTVPALVPLLIISHAWLTDSAKHARWVYKLMPPALALVILVRLYMITDIEPLTSVFKDEMHGNPSWATTIKEKAGGLPVVFLNSYQRPSKYWFYTGDTSFGLNTTRYRRNNYNFWPIEKEWQGKTAYTVDRLLERLPDATPIETRKGLTYGKAIPTFQSNSWLRFQAISDDLSITDGKLSPFNFTVFPTSSADSLLTGTRPLEVVLDVFGKDSMIARLPLRFTNKEGNWYGSSNDSLSLAPGFYRAKIGVGTVLPLLYSQNSASVKLRVR